MMKQLFVIATLLFTVTFGSAFVRATAQETAHTRANPSPVRVSAEETDAAEPSIAAAKDGSVFVVWVEHRANGAADLWLAHLDADGRRLSAPVRINGRAGEATAWRGDPPTVALAPDGRTIYVGWTARDRSKTDSAAAGHASTIYLSASRDGGRTFAPPVRVNDDPQPAAHGMHSLAVAADGRVHLAWLDERNVAAPPAHDAKGKTAGHQMEANREVFAAYSSDGGRTFSRNSLIARDACPCCKTSLAAGANKRVYVSWRQVLAGDYRHIAVAASTDGGQKFNAPVVVSDDRWQLNGCPVSGAALAVGGDGDDDSSTLRVAWYTAGEAGTPGIYWSESRDGGRTFAPRAVVAAGKAQGTPALLTASAANGGGAFVVWESREDKTSRPASARINRSGRVERAGTPLLPLLSQGGELPSAALSAKDGRLFIAFVTKSGERRGVHFLRAEDSGGERIASSDAPKSPQ